MQQLVKFLNGDKQHIVRAHENRESINQSADTAVMVINDAPAHAARLRRTDRVRVAKKTMLKPKTQLWVTVTAKRTGSAIIEPIAGLLSTQSISTACGVYHIQNNVPFKMLVANFGKKDVVLPRKMMLAQAFTGQYLIQDTDVSMSDALGVEL